jgi:predicted CopG family antitoxin
MVSGRKNITVSQDTYDRLKGYGKFGESYDDLLNRLMNIVEARQKK